jgi:AraC-like DNA-binding protein
LPNCSRSGTASAARESAARALFLARTSAPLLDAVLRLARLLDTPVAEAAVLAPLALREIHYRVLTGELGERLRQLCEVDGPSQRIARAIERLKSEYAQPLRIEEARRAAHMSASSLHQRFKAVTSMSPLQFQKQLRLQEARRLMLSEGMEAAVAGHRVGYESPRNSAANTGACSVRRRAARSCRRGWRVADHKEKRPQGGRFP